MNTRAFFSVFVTLFAIIFLVSLFHAQHTKQDLQAREMELSMLHQHLSKDWFLARNALSNFTSDAVLNKIKGSVNNYATCASFAVPTTIDFAPDVNAYWDTALNYMNARFLTHCDANLSGAIEVQMSETYPALEEFRSNERAYGLLSCTRSTNNASLTITRPFVVRKLVEKDIIVPGSACRISVYDILGTNDNPTLNYSHKKLDVNETFV